MAAGHPETARAAAEVLSAGGNAYDAALAAGFAAAVAEPALTSLGGGGFLLAATAEGEQVLVDFFVDTPGRGLPVDALEPHFTPVTVKFASAEQVFHVGWGSVAVPGCLNGYLHVHQRFGRLDLAEIVAPARRMARDGVPVNAIQAHVLDLLTGVVTLTEEGWEVFAPRGHVLTEGERLRNPAYGDLLDELAAGNVAGMNAPAVSDGLLTAMRRHGGLLTRTDLDSYRVIEREPLRMAYRGSEVLTNPPPSFGGGLVLQALEALAADGAADNDVTGTVRLCDALVAMGQQHAASRHVLSTEAFRTSRGTTQISVADTQGNVASMTTSNGSCSGVFAPGTGVHLNNIMGEDDLHPGGFHAAPPGLRVGSMMAPSVVLDPDGTCLALGSGGSERIRSALTQVLVNLLDRGMSLEQAVEHPRMHWDGSVLQVEPGLADAVVEALYRHQNVNLWESHNLYFGGAHVVGLRMQSPNRDAVRTASRDAGRTPSQAAAAGDPRRGGSVWIG